MTNKLQRAILSIGKNQINKTALKQWDYSITSTLFFYVIGSLFEFNNQITMLQNNT